MQKDFSVIIVSYNNYKVLADCLNSIEQMNDIGDRLEVIVVEQSPMDDIYNELRENYPNIVLLRAENKGFGAGNNCGAKIAQGKYLLFLNPDTILIEPIFKFAIEAFEKDNTIGCFGVQLIDMGGKKNHSFGLRISLGLANQVLNKIYSFLGIFLPKKMYISGADIFIPKAIFDEIGGFDENLFMYCEEPDICNRINAIGKKIRFFKKKRIVHLEGKTDNSKLSEKQKINLESIKYYCGKYGIDSKKAFASECSYCMIKYYVFKLFQNEEKMKCYDTMIKHINNLVLEDIE